MAPAVTSTSDWPLVGLAASRIDELPDPIGGAVSDAGDDHAAVAVADENHVTQVFEVQQVHDVADVHVEVDRGADEVSPVATPGQARRIDVVTLRTEEPSDLPVAPAAMPATVHQHVVRHGRGQYWLLKRGQPAVRTCYFGSPRKSSTWGHACSRAFQFAAASCPPCSASDAAPGW